MAESELTGDFRRVSTMFATEDPVRPAARTHHSRRIAEVSVQLVQRPYLVPFEISSGGTPVLTSLLVRIRTSGDGAGPEADVDGFGETTEMTAYTGETAAGLADVVTGVLAPAIIGGDLFDLAGLHLRMDEAVRGRSVAKAAVDLAVVDAQGRQLGLPAWALLGGRVRRQVPLAWVIGLGPTEQILQEASERVEAGFRHIKLKGGLDPDRDVVVVEKVVAALGPGIEVSLDANGAYESHTVLPALRAMERAGLALIEQPVPGWDFAGMRRLTAALDLPVMADESLQSVQDAVRLVEEQACDVINIKVLKVGGLHRSRQVAAVAEAAGIPVKVGSMPELGLATLAGLHFAASVPGARVAADLIGPLMVDQDVVDGPDLRAAGSTGSLTVPDTPGLGADVSRHFATEGSASLPSRHR